MNSPPKMKEPIAVDAAIGSQQMSKRGRLDRGKVSGAQPERQLPGIMARGRLVVEALPDIMPGDEIYYAFARNDDLWAPSAICSIYIGDLGVALAEALAWQRDQRALGGLFDKVVIVAPSGSRLAATDERGKHLPIADMVRP